jgi:hypothetical protein
VREKENVLMSLVRIDKSRFEALTDRIEFSKANMKMKKGARLGPEDEA